MQVTEIDRIVLDILCQVAPEASVGSLRPHLPFRDQFAFDSVDFLNFVLKLEERTGCRIEELDYPTLSSLDGCRAYLGKAS